MPAEERISSIILLKHTLEKIPGILEVLNGCQCSLLKFIQIAMSLGTPLSIVVLQS